MREAEWDAWDKQIEADLEAGRLDKLLKQVKDEHKRGLTILFEEGKRKFDQAFSSSKLTK